MQLQGSWWARIWRAAMAGVLALAAVGCSDTDDGGPEGTGGGTATLAGTAAVGAPIVGGAITAKCSGGQTFSATSAANGGYSIELPSSALPCALQVSGGTVGGAANTQSLHSFASRSGTVNLTPLTDLAVALASGSNPVAWFNAVNAANPPDLDELTPAINTLLSKLRGAGYSVPANLNPVTTPFAPTASNAYDQLLEALADRLRQAETNYADLLVQVVEEGDDFEPPAAEEEPDGGTPEGTVPGTVSSLLVGSFTLTFNLATDNANKPVVGAPFADKQQVPVVIGSDNTLKIDGKTLTNPYFRKFGGQPHLPEIIWLDAVKKIEYALSDNERGTFNEINVGDASQAGVSGIPRFLGQLPKPKVTVTLPASLNGSYTTRIVDKSGPINFTVGNNLTVVIASDSIAVDGDRYLFQASDLEYEIFNETASIEPRYRVSKKTDATHVQDLYIYVDGDAVVGFKLSLTELGNGTSSTSYVVAEKRPLPQNVLDFFDLAVSKTPVVLTVVQDDTSYNSGYPAKCATMRLTVDKTGTGDAVAFKYTVKRGADYQEWVDEQSYAASNTRYLENSGNKILAFSRNRISLRADGKVDLTALLGASVKDRATNDPDQILLACPP